MKPRIRLVDRQFAHTKGGMGNGDLPIFPSHFDWHRGDDRIGDVVVITETSFPLVQSQPEPIKVGYILEPRSIWPDIYRPECKAAMARDFRVVYTHDQAFIDQPVDGQWPCEFRWAPLGGTWIMPDKWGVRQKTKRFSIIASGKNQTVGHRLRHEAIRRYAAGYGIDVYGRGYTAVKDKADALADYEYSIVIENERSDVWFTEKLIDCLALGTIPIYWGCPSIGSIFGDIPCFSCADELGDVLSAIVEGGICPTATSALANLDAARTYAVTEDWLWDHGLREIVF